ncbi:MAG: hypothetical protein K1X48_10375 [Burkholderiaceae bacterium]|nr:hypothetical protein [Burkholderiaceae bacterium]
MNKLLKLKNWLTIPEAVKQLTITLEEEITEIDLLQLVLDGHLDLSIYFVNHQMARRGKVVPIENARYVEVPTNLFRAAANQIESEEEDQDVSNNIIVLGLELEDGKVIDWEDELHQLDGIYDLTMLGGEKSEIQQKLQDLRGLGSIDYVHLDGIFLKRGEYFFQLQVENVDAQSNSVDSQYYPTIQLPEDAALVVRVEALIELEKTLANVETVTTLLPATESDIDPVDQPEELDAANIAFRRVSRGYGDKALTFRNRLLAFLEENYSHLKSEAIERIATVANPDKTRGRKKNDKE